MIIYQARIYRADLTANPTVTYVFGDNMARVGFGGQAAEMRGEPNAFGIPTCRAPGIKYRPVMDQVACLVQWRMDCFHLEHKIHHGIVVFPSDGIGTGLARMPFNLKRVLDEILLDTCGIVNGPKP